MRRADAGRSRGASVKPAFVRSDDAHTMAGDRPRYGSMVSALGAIVLAVGVFLPWYGLSFTAHGIALAQQVGSQFASQYGNATLQSYMGALHTNLSGLAGHQFASVSAHQALTNLNVVLLIIAALGTLVALLALAGPESASSQANRSPLALLGAVATLFVLYRMIDPPAVAGNLLALSLREGVWLSLLGSLAMTGGALWPRTRALARPAEAGAQGVWAELSGWTPDS